MSDNVFNGPEFIALAIAIPILGGWGLNIWGLVTCARTKDEDFRAIGKTRGGQMTLHIVGIFLYVVGAVVGWIWLATTRKQLLAINTGRPTGTLPPPPPPGA